MRLVDDGFWDNVHGVIESSLELGKELVPYLRHIDPTAIAKAINLNAKTTTNIMFAHVPEINGAPWPADITAAWLRDQKHWEVDPHLNYIYFRVEGTTFSGHPTKTTLGNTLRSLCYAWWHLEECGVSEPWRKEKNDSCFAMAAGDDLVYWAHPKLAHRLADHIRSHCADRAGLEASIGLGQVIKSVEVKKWWEIDFCSKISICPSGELGDMRLYRCPKKSAR